MNTDVTNNTGSSDNVDSFVYIVFKIVDKDEPIFIKFLELMGIYSDELAAIRVAIELSKDSHDDLKFAVCQMALNHLIPLNFKPYPAAIYECTIFLCDRDNVLRNKCGMRFNSTPAEYLTCINDQV